MIVKPSNMYASFGIETTSVCWNRESVYAQVHRMKTHPVLIAGIGVNVPIFVERFILGREFTALIVGRVSFFCNYILLMNCPDSTSNQPEDIIVYPVAERRFKATKPLKERFVCHDEYYADPDLLEYHLAEDELQPALQDIAKRYYMVQVSNQQSNKVLGHILVCMGLDMVELTCE
jgi:hypothetical protein